MVKVRRSDSQAQFRGRLKILQRGFQTAFVYLGRTTAEPPASFVGLFHVLFIYDYRLPSFLNRQEFKTVRIKTIG